MRRRLRRSTIRGRIVALTVLPVIALMTLWTFAMVSVTGDLRALVRLQSVYESFGTPVDTAVGQIQIERRLAAGYLGAAEDDADSVGTADTSGTAAYLAQQRSTDRAVQTMREAIRDQERREDLSERQQESLDTMDKATAQLEGLRRQVLARSLSWSGAVDAYTAIVEPTFDVQSTLTALQAGQLAREAQVVVELVRVREFVSREDALVAGARAAGRLSDAQYDVLTATIEDRRVFHRTYVGDLPADSAALFGEFERSTEYRSLVAGENALLRAGASGASKAIAANSWRTTTDLAVKRYMRTCTASALNAADRGRDFAYREMVKAGVVGGLGLIAVVISIWLSVSAGRRIARRLEELRDAADVLATRQLPEVMERLAAGDEVDAAEVAPPIRFGDDKGEPDEISQVGHALNTARRAAVEAAVKQATLRRGMFAVLLNIARRNQALVHRQSKLVDTLERRTTDPDTLEDLFRIDHLTTRMRRHAEGLIILSGAAPGRRWRQPVPLADVVSAAVGEIEDYTRVVIPPMPPVGITAEAVADVVHLVAELVDNATAFSPPHTQVTMRTGEARNGFVLEVDDRGLGMDREEFDQVHRTLARPGDFDPVLDERLGLYIVGRLAARHGITVTLTRSPYGGTTAVVLLPHTITSLVEPAAPAAPEPAPSAGAVVHTLPTRGHRPEAAPAATDGTAADDTPTQDTPTAILRAVTDTTPPPDRPGGEPLVPERAQAGGPYPRTASGPAPVLPQRTRKTPGTQPGASPRDGHGPGDTGRGGGSAVHGGPAEAHGAASGGGPAATTEETRLSPSWRGHGRPDDPTGAGPAAALEPFGGRPGHESGVPSTEAVEAPVPAGPDGGDATGPRPLPRRVRQASLAAPLRDTPGDDARREPAKEVSAEEMRAIFGAFQRGLDRGRKGDPAGRESMSDEGTGQDG
ncbi:nitrate- and nitrite sensing domain-containing protein [Streptomyces sp. NPDC127084]|uniref:sensor histidine kinase n=1 Tax=Streptomyces sp. NPDC127084 TaxID=3347133 RepID=UPI00364699B6